MTHTIGDPKPGIWTCEHCGRTHTNDIAICIDKCEVCGGKLIGGHDHICDTWWEAHDAMLAEEDQS